MKRAIEFLTKLHGEVSDYFGPVGVSDFMSESADASTTFNWHHLVTSRPGTAEIQSLQHIVEKVREHPVGCGFDRVSYAWHCRRQMSKEYGMLC